MFESFKRFFASPEKAKESELNALQQEVVQGTEQVIQSKQVDTVLQRMRDKSHDLTLILAFFVASFTLGREHKVNSIDTSNVTEAARILNANDLEQAQSLVDENVSFEQTAKTVQPPEKLDDQ